MTPQSEALQIIITALNSAFDVDIKIDALPADGGVTAEVTGGENKGRYLDITHGNEDLTVLFLCKNVNQQTAYNTVCSIGNYLNALKAIEGETVNILGCGVRSGASLVSHDGDYYVYSLIASIKINF